MKNAIPWNRNATLVALGQIESPASTKLLRKVLAGEIESRPCSELAGETNIDRWPSSDDPAVPKKCADNIYAAYLLALRRDVASKRSIEQLLQSSVTEEEKALLRKALGLFEE